MYQQTNDRYSDRGGCGDEFYLDASLKATSVLAALYGAEQPSAIDELDDADDVAAN